MARPAIVLAHWAGISFFGDDGLARIGEVGRLLNREAVGSWDDERAPALLAEAEVLLGHWGCPPIDGKVLDMAPKLRLIAYAAGTVKGTVSDAVFERGVRVSSGADANAEPVAEFTLAAILFANKEVFWRRDALRDGSIEAHRQLGDVPVGNWDKTVGLVGASTIGRRVIELLAAFPALRIAVYDPFLSDEDAEQLGVVKLGLDELCATADVVSLHAPDLPTTRGMIGAEQLGAMRTGATFINTARPAVVDQEALLAELEAGRLYAVLDVTDPEPLPVAHPLRSLPNVFLTPHIAGSQGTELGRMTDYAAEEIRRFSCGEPLRNEVTSERLIRMA